MPYWLWQWSRKLVQMADIADGNLWPLGWMLIIYITLAFYSNILVGNDFYYAIFICIVK